MASSVFIGRIARLALFACVASSALPATGVADPLSLLDQLTDNVGQSQQLTLRTLRSDRVEMLPEWRAPAAPLERDAADPFRLDDGPEHPAGVLASRGRLGFAVDLGGGPGALSGGVAWSPNETVSIGAGGGLDHGIEGRLYFRLRF